MALNKDTLGGLLYNARLQFQGKTADELIQAYGSLDDAFLAACKADAEAIINHFKNDGTVPALGLNAPNGPVTGTAHIV